MKKTMSLFLLITCMTLVFSFSASAERSSAKETIGRTHMGNTVPDTGTRAGDGVSTDGRTGAYGTYGTNDYGINNTGTRTNVNNNYRARATTNNNNWSWLGLLGLIGLAGLRNRGRERT
jgi:hypothetical protein